MKKNAQTQSWRLAVQVLGCVFVVFLVVEFSFSGVLF